MFDTTLHLLLPSLHHHRDHLHQQDDEDLNDSDNEHLTDDEHHELQKLSRSVNAEGVHVEEEVGVISTSRNVLRMARVPVLSGA